MRAIELPHAGLQVVLGALGLDAFVNRRIGDLSKGQRKRVLLAFALLAPRAGA